MTASTGSNSDHEELILSHAVTAALASAIPIPLLDDAVKDRVQRRMVGALARAHHLDLSEEQVALLADDRSELLTGALKSVVLWPLKKALQKTFLILAARKVVVVASECFQRGLLFDHAFATGACAPTGAYRPEQVRAAVDSVLEQVRGGPIESAIVAGLGESRLLVTEGLLSLWAKIRGRIAALKPDAHNAAADAEAAADEMTEAAAPGVAALVARLRASIADVQEDHFADLRRRLTAELGGEPGRDA